MLTDALSGSFAACARLFSRYPLAITQYRADHGFRAMVLMSRAGGTREFFVLVEASDEEFVIRSLHCEPRIDHGIRPGEPVSGIVRKVITDGMPVPHDGALLGWVTDSQVTVLLAAYCRQPATRAQPVPVPEIRVMPMAGTRELLDWPPFTVSPFDGRLWEYVERQQIVDVVPLLCRGTGRAYWVPAPDRRSARHEDGCVVIGENMAADDYWLPAGVYMDHWVLREGFTAPPVNSLLGLPGVVDLTCRVR